VQAIKVLRAGPLHSHLFRDRSKIVPELYEQFRNSASQRSNTSASLSSKGKHRSKTKLQGLATKIINTITPSRCTTSIPMVVGHQRTGKRILDHLRKKGTMQPSIRGPLITASEVSMLKNFGPPPQERNHATFYQRSTHYSQ
jgi:hypothetical protein